MIVIEDLVKHYGRVTAVDGLRLRVGAGEALALWGPNGAGKTTVVRCVLGLLHYRGRITIDGFDARRHGRIARRRVGYVPQELAFHDHWSALDAARFYGRLRGMGRHRPAEVLALVGLADHAAKRVGALSGGMKQRLALGLAMLSDPPVLVLDEPTASLDAEARGQFLALLRGVRDEGTAVLFSSHRLAEVEQLADRVLVMADGRERLTCTAADLAATLAMRQRLHVRVDAEAVEAALAALTDAGLSARRNAAGVVVDVLPGEKALPIAVLDRSAIAVRDFELE